MEIVKQIWASSPAVRIALSAAAIGLVLAVVCAGRDGKSNSAFSVPDGPPQIIEDLKDRIGGGVAGKYSGAGGKVADAVGKVAHTTGRVADTVDRGMDVVDGALDTVLGEEQPKTPTTTNP